MKKLILSAALMAFALVAAQAGDAKVSKTAAAQDEPACCAKCKESTKVSAKASAKASTKVSMEDSDSCPFAKGACCGHEMQTAARKTLVKHALLSPKAAASL